jgi:hypothetical protein
LAKPRRSYFFFRFFAVFFAAFFFAAKAGSTSFMPLLVLSPVSSGDSTGGNHAAESGRDFSGHVEGNDGAAVVHRRGQR